MEYLSKWVSLFTRWQSSHIQFFVQFPNIYILVNITVVETYSPLDNSTKLTSNNSIVKPESRPFPPH